MYLLVVLGSMVNEIYLYIEYDVYPTTIHHKSKRTAEIKIKNLNSDYLIIRTGWLFGGNWHSKKILSLINAEAKLSKGIIYTNKSQKGNPLILRCSFCHSGISRVRLSRCI